MYKVKVFTGNVFNAGTDANVYITMFGENGDSGERKLIKSDTYRDKFEKGHVSLTLEGSFLTSVIFFYLNEVYAASE